jgi:hypothetical protein
MADTIGKRTPVDKSNWEYVEVPETDIFDKPFDGVSINFIPYNSGKHFVEPEIAGEIRRLLSARMKADMRILRPTTDKKALEIMARSGKPLTPSLTIVE